MKHPQKAKRSYPRKKRRVRREKSRPSPFNLASRYFFIPEPKLRVSPRTKDLITLLDFFAHRSNYKKYHDTRFLLNRTPEYKNFRQRVLARDDWTCVYCKNFGYQVHHVVHVFDDPFSVFDISIAVTVCSPCHAKQHGK